ncbi:MAG TPA: pyridoxal 5'-phosphate synthase glutaminase subunit PdxT [Acidimicrobiales bacterium]|nr:pyridoxal 5'-phosphate synthase glutaminase subunit PdxT [Acidimicrobiales bacterium]
MKVGILALQGDVREHSQVLAELGAHPVEVRVPEDLTGVDAVVIPGGESTTISLLLGSSGLRDPLGDRLRDGMPALGTCAGMVLLAREVLDGRADQASFAAIDLTVRRNAFGRQVASFETDLDLPGLAGGPLHAVFIRAPVVERAGAGVEVLASVEGVDGVPRPVLCRQGAVLVAAFHPELSGDWRVHELFLAGR